MTAPDDDRTPSQPTPAPETRRSGGPHQDSEPRTFTGPIPTTMTGGIPVLEDLADRDLAHLPSEAEYARTRSKVTVMVIVVLTTLSAIGPLATDMYIPAFPDVTSDLGTTAALLQLTITAFFVGTAGGQIVAGPLSDRLGRRGPLLVGIVLCLVGSIVCALAPNIQVLLIFRVLQGIGGGFGMVLGRAVLIDLTDGPELFRTMNIMQGVGGVAPIVAPLLGGLILLVGQWREVFLVIAAMSLISLIGVLLLIPESLPRSRRHSGGFRLFLTSTGDLLRRPQFTSYMMVNAFSAFSLMAYVAASSFVMQEMLGFSSQEYSVLFAINSVGMMAMSLTSARLSGRVAPRTLVKVGLSVTSVASVSLLIGALLLGTPAWIVIPGFFLMVAPQGLIFGNAGALASREALDRAGTGSALLGLGFSFSASIASPLVGVAGTESAVPMGIVMVVGVAASVTCLVIAGRTRHRATA